MEDTERIKKFNRLYREYLRLARKLDRVGGPERDGALFEDLLAIEDEILSLFGLTCTAVNQELIQLSLGHRDPASAGLETYQLLVQKAEIDNAKNEAPLEILLRGVSDGESAMNVLPKMGIDNHTYNIFLYNLISRNVDLIIVIYNEMVRASKYLGELGRIKFAYDDLRDKNLAFLDAYLASQYEEIIEE